MSRARKSDGGAEQTAPAQTMYTCEAGTVEVLKLTEGVVDPSKDWSFTLTEGPDGFGGAVIGSAASLPDLTPHVRQRLGL